MGTLLRLLRVIRARGRRDRLDDQLADEIRLHLELRTQALTDEGMDPADAAREARRMFGNTAVIREEARDMWGVGWIESVLQDLRYAIRMLRRSPFFAAVAIASLAIGLGAASAVFSVVDAVRFRELAVRAPAELREFRAVVTFGAARKLISGVDETVLADVQRGASFGELLGFRSIDVSVTSHAGESPRAMRAELVSSNYFDLLGLVPRAGRLPGQQYDREATPSVVISERLWRSAFGSDPAIPGRRIVVNGLPASIAGVVGKFHGVMAERPADVFVPLEFTSLVDPAAGATMVRLIARLGPGVSTAAAEQAMAALYLGVAPPAFRTGNLRVTLPDASLGISDVRASLDRPLSIAMGLVGVLLLIACANTGGLLLSRFAARQGEFGVRMAIGAGRARLVRQLIVEALVLAALSAVAGLFIGWLAAPLLLLAFPAAAGTLAFDVRLDWRVAAFTAAIAGAAALSIAAAAVFRILGSRAPELLAGESRTIASGGRRLATSLIAAQVACSLVLLVGAGAMTRTLFNLRSVDPGFNPDGAFAVHIDASGRFADPSALHGYQLQLLERFRSSPHIAYASLAQVGLMSGAATTGSVDAAGFSSATDDDRLSRMFFVGSDFFEAAGMRVLLGRGITATDTAGSPVAVANRSFADFYFGGPEQALGRTVNGNTRIVGIAADAHYDTLRDAPARALFLPFTQVSPRAVMVYVVRSSGDHALTARTILETVRTHDPRLQPRVTPLADQLANTLSREQFVARLALVLSGLALFLACAGVYAAAAYAVVERRAEIGIRVALGATRADVVGLMLRRPIAATAAGVALGLPGAAIVMTAMASLLYGVAPFDVSTVVAAAVLLVTVAIAAGLPAARRAAAIDPQDALRWQ